MKKICVLSFLILFVSVGLAMAGPVSWNGNVYERIDAEVTWDEANAQASAMTYNGVKGHLVTITSAAENLFLTYNANLGGGEANNYLHVHWTGGYQPAGSEEPGGGWAWVTGEAFTYNNWAAPGEPNNYGDEMYIGFDHGFTADGKQWNDLPALWDTSDPNSALYKGAGFIVEYDRAAPVPEPSTMLLLGFGLAGVAYTRRKFKK